MSIGITTNWFVLPTDEGGGVNFKNFGMSVKLDVDPTIFVDSFESGGADAWSEVEP